MKNALFIFLVFFILFSGCSKQEEIFKGEVKFVKKPSIDKLTGEKLYLNGLYAGSPVVLDTIISFVHYYNDYFVSSFDINTGEHIGNFLRRGQGPYEYINMGLLYPESGYDYWFNELNKRHSVLIDMSSGEERKGFRIPNTHGFNFVRVPSPPENRSYRSYKRVSVDDDFVYAMLDNISEPDAKPVIHVFNWEGDFVRILEPDQKGTTFDLHKTYKKLYIKDEEEEENVWVYDVNYLYE